MIALQRTRTDKGIPAGFRDKGRQTKQLNLLKAKRDGTLAALFKAAPWGPAKPRLRIESLNKCAYCESPAESQHGDVEHFRPKSVWWWLALCYDNYLLSCQICNQSYKGDKFPLGTGGRARGEPKVKATDSDARLATLVDSLGPDAVAVTAGRTLAAHLADCKAEKPLLIHPCDENPADFIIYEADATLSLGVLSSSYPLDVPGPVLATGAQTLWQEWHLIDRDLVERCAMVGIRVIAWTVNDAAVARHLGELGVAGVCGNWPERLVVRR